jgi:hypothetical protein
MSEMERVWVEEKGLLSESKDRTEPQAMSLSEFTTRLLGLEPEKWADLYLCGYMSTESALAAGPGVVDSVAAVMRALLPLYEASTLEGRFSKSRA